MLCHLPTRRIHHHDVAEDELITMRTAWDATLPMPGLILPPVQMNMRGGELPPAEENGDTISSFLLTRCRSMQTIHYLWPLSGGLMIGLSAALYLVLNGRVAGISGLTAAAVGLSSERCQVSRCRAQISLPSPRQAVAAAHAASAPARNWRRVGRLIRCRWV